MEMVTADRAAFDSTVTADELRAFAGRPEVAVLQSATTVNDSVWGLLNECFFASRPDVQLRVYGHYSTPCDLAFASRMTHVRHFAADCLARATNVEAIAGIPQLQSLSLGIFELQSFDVLKRVAPTLTTLSLGATRSKKPNLAALSRFGSLKVLYLEGHSNGIDALSELRDLEDVTLRSITTPDLSYLAPLARLWSLDIKLGGTRSLDALAGKESIKYLELWQVRDLRNADVIAALPGLQNLFLQSLPRLETLPALVNAKALRRVILESLKGFRDFGTFEWAPALEEFSLIDGKGQVPEQLLPVLRNPSVRRAGAGFGSDRKNRAFARLRDEHGKAEWAWKAFEYR